MPEGPEIRRAADRVARAIQGKPLTEVSFAFDRLEPYQEKLRGQAVSAIDTHGKAMLTRFEGGLVLYSHNQLYGRWYVRRAGNDPTTNRQLRVALRTASHSALLYSASDVDLIDRSELALHPFLRRLGIDPLWKETTREELEDRLTQPEFERRSLGGLLLDQGFVAGLGNYLRTEILWTSRLHPRHRPIDLNQEQRAQLAGKLLELPRRSYRTGGVTNPPSLVARLESAGSSKRHSRFAAFARAGRPCLRCDTSIDRLEVGSRRLYLCPLCQPEPSR